MCAFNIFRKWIYTFRNRMTALIVEPWGNLRTVLNIKPFPDETFHPSSNFPCTLKMPLKHRKIFRWQHKTQTKRSVCIESRFLAPMPMHIRFQSMTIDNDFIRMQMILNASRWWWKVFDIYDMAIESLD